MHLFNLLQNKSNRARRTAKSVRDNTGTGYRESRTSRNPPQSLPEPGATKLRKERFKIMCRTMDELTRVVEDYRSLKALKEQLEAELKDAERDILNYLDSHEKLSETGSNFTVKVTTCERRTVDTKRLEADLGSLAEYQRVSQYRRLYVK